MTDNKRNITINHELIQDEYAEVRETIDGGVIKPPYRRPMALFGVCEKSDATERGITNMNIGYYTRKQPSVEAVVFWLNNVPEIMEWLGPAFRGIMNLAPGNFKSASAGFPSIDISDDVRDGIADGQQYNVLVIEADGNFTCVTEGQYIVKDPVLGFIPIDRDKMSEFYEREQISVIPSNGV